MKWRAMKAADLGDVKNIAAAIHVDFPEDDAVFAERRELFPAGCAVLVAGRRVLGYCFAHPWMFGHVPPLNSLLTALPEQADTLYIHDVALLPPARGQNAFPPFLAKLEFLSQRAHYATMTLTAVGNTWPFWQKNRFITIETQELVEKLKSYGESAYFMARPVTPC